MYNAPDQELHEDKFECDDGGPILTCGGAVQRLKPLPTLCVSTDDKLRLRMKKKRVRMKKEGKTM